MTAPIVRIQIPYILTDLQVQALYVWLETVCSNVEKRRPLARRSQRHHDQVREQRELLLLHLESWQEDVGDSVLRQELHELRRSIRQQRHDYWQVRITGGEQLGTVPVTSALRPFGVDVQAYEPLRWEDCTSVPLELHSLRQAIGSLPKQRIELIGFLENVEDHFLAAHMAAELADQYHAYVQLRVQPEFYTARGAQEWTLEASRELAASLSGSHHEILYHSARSAPPRAYYLVDGEFMRAWAEQPRFQVRS